MSRSENQSARSNTISPSVGSFHVLSRKFDTRESGLGRLPQIQRRSEAPVTEQGEPDVQGFFISPRRRKGVPQRLDLDSIEEQVMTPRSMENCANRTPETDAQVVTPRRGKGHCTEPAAMKGTPKQKRLQAQAAEGGKDTPKRSRGALKVVAAEALEESKLLKTTEDFEDDNDNEGGEGVEEGEFNHATEEGASDHDEAPATKSGGKKGTKNSKAKKPVAQRVSVSKVTRAAAGKVAASAK